MPRKRDRDAPRVVHRTARCGLRLTRAPAGPGVRAAAVGGRRVVLRPGARTAWRRRRQDAPLAGYRELCRELAASGPGTFGELDSTGARSVLRRYCDAWFAAARRRKDGDSRPATRAAAGPGPGPLVRGHVHPRRAAAAAPGREGLPAADWSGWTGTSLPAGQVRSVTLGFDAGRLYLDVTAEVPVAAYPAGAGPGPGPGGRGGPGHHPPLRRRRTGRAGAAGVRAGDPGRVPAAPARPQGPLPGRRPPRPQARAAGVAAVAAAPPQRARRRRPGTRRRVRQAQHEAAKDVIAWAVEHRIGTLAVGDPRGVLNLNAGRQA